MPSPDKIWTAALVVIGDEILSGRTHDKNIAQVASWLQVQGIRLAEVRVVPDVEERIAEAVNALRTTHDYLFTTGGIGPTHDDITSECVARAFGVPLVLDPAAVERLRRGRGELNEARLKMARVPAGAALVENPVSHAPGFRIGNVFVYAGIPAIMRAMFAASVPMLTQGSQILSASVDVYAREGDLAEPLERIALAHPEVEIGSYPFAREGRFGASLVVRGTDAAAVERVLGEVRTAMVALAGKDAVL